jgi:hypothetical protein
VNNFKIRLTPEQKYFNIPIKINYDLLGREDLVNEFVEDTIEKVINPIKDFELTRFGHKTWLSGDTIQSLINQKFYFFNREIDVDTTNNSNETNWLNSYNYTTVPDYTGQSFTNKEIYYFSNSFKRSFFKLDLYDTPDSETQKLYLTIIIPTQQGLTTEVDIGTEITPLLVNIKTPNFILDYIGDKEGYFIYWLKNQEQSEINEFYMSAKFFNAKIGQFVRMTTLPQSNFSKKFNLERQKYFYRKIILDYSTYEYEVKNIITGARVGTETPIKWYEYVNPS